MAPSTAIRELLTGGFLAGSHPACSRTVAGVGRVAFVVWDGGGNVPPAIALGQRLAAAGHTVEGYGGPSLARRFTDAGLGYTVRDVDDAWDVTAMALDVADHCARTEPDAVVVDYMLPGALCGAERGPGRVVAYVHTLYTALLDGGDHPSPMGMAASPAAVDEARGELGLEPVGTLGALLHRSDQVVVTCPQELDAPNASLPENVRYVGPAFEPAGGDGGWSPPPGDDPLVVVSMGTTPMDEAPAVQAVLDGLAEAPVRVLAMCGRHLAEDAIRLPPNATRCGFVRHAAVLPHAAAVVCHAGLGTVLATLAHGLPLVCVPLGRDQPANAAAVARVGAGRVVAPTASPAELRAAVLDVLGDDAVTAASGRMAVAIGGPSAGGAAADAIAMEVDA
jgi:UDP:flavonoid glycosyltransferase YjiC (YdhE family)